MQERAPDDVLGIFWYRIVHPKWYAFQRSTSAAQLARELESMAAAARQPEPAKTIDVPRPFDDFVFLPPPGRWSQGAGCAAAPQVPAGIRLRRLQG